MLLALVVALATAGAPGMQTEAVADSAWQATYRMHDRRGERQLVVICDADTIELRAAGEPVRVWQRLGDGVEHRVLIPKQHLEVAFAPGDVRALGRDPQWQDVRGIVPSRLVADVGSAAAAVAGHLTRRHAGVEGASRYDITWIGDAGLPARYLRSDSSGETSRMDLVELRSVAGSTAFTSTDDLRRVDAPDLGDEQMDPALRAYVIGTL